MAEFSNTSATLASQLKFKTEGKDLVVAGVSSKWGGRRPMSVAIATSQLHTYSEEEKTAFSQHINDCLGSDPHLAHLLPLNTESADLFLKANDGLLLCKLVNVAVRDTIDERCLNVKTSLNVYQKTENINLALNAAKSIGCQVVNIGAADIMEGTPTLILGLVWQIIKIQLLSVVSLKCCPELVVLLQEGEELQTFMKLPPETILLRWFNYHLARAGYAKMITNFGPDIVDSEAYSVLLHQLNPLVCPLTETTDPALKAREVIGYAAALGSQPFIRPRDICEGNKKLNLTFIAQIFNVCPGLAVPEEVRAQFDLSTLEIDDVGDSREERVFRMWINSLCLDEVFVNDLFGDLQNGVIFLKLEDYLDPGIVPWKKVTSAPGMSKFKKVENTNLVVNIGKEMKFSLVNVGGVDIVDGNKKIILAITWQLLRRYTLQVLSDLAASDGSAEMSEERVVLWANEKVTRSGKSRRIRNLKDKSTADSLFFLELIAAVEPRAVEWELVTAGVTEEEKLLNAKFAISSARKLGACVFLTPEDIIETKSKMLLTLIASIWTAELEHSQAAVGGR